MRLDVFLTEKGYCESRNKASDAIKNGCVFVDGLCVKKPSLEIVGTEKIEVRGLCPYVGRGGYKLEGAIRSFGLNVSDLVCVDIGSSTGGFTDCLLQNGAKKVYAVDSGRDQLHPSLRCNPKVVCMEEFNARYLDASHLSELCDLAVMDVSFISQTLLYGGVSRVLKDGGLFVSLIKPQFEAGKEHLGKNGIVKDEKVRHQVCQKIAKESVGFGLENIDIIPSPIEGGDGNKEFLALFRFNKSICGE